MVNKSLILMIILIGITISNCENDNKKDHEKIQTQTNQQQKHKINTNHKPVEEKETTTDKTLNGNRNEIKNENKEEEEEEADDEIVWPTEHFSRFTNNLNNFDLRADVIFSKENGIPIFIKQGFNGELIRYEPIIFETESSTVIIGFKIFINKKLISSYSF
jgi:hypothetical protein